MALMSYLLKDRHGTYYFRRVIPLALRPFIPAPWTGKVEWKRSLKTKTPAEAKRAAARALSDCTADFMAAELALRGEPAAPAQVVRLGDGLLLLDEGGVGVLECPLEYLLLQLEGRLEARIGEARHVALGTLVGIDEGLALVGRDEALPNALLVAHTVARTPLVLTREGCYCSLFVRRSRERGGVIGAR